MTINAAAPALCLELGFVQLPSSIPTLLTLPSCDGLPGGAALGIALIVRLPQQAREVLDPARGELAELSGPSPGETGLLLDLDETQDIQSPE